MIGRWNSANVLGIFLIYFPHTSFNPFAYDRDRVDGSFVAIAATSGTNTVSIDAEGQVVLFDSSSSVISNTLQVHPLSLHMTYKLIFV
jgi:hypothetical protein